MQRFKDITISLTLFNMGNSEGTSEYYSHEYFIANFKTFDFYKTIFKGIKSHRSKIRKNVCLYKSPQQSSELFKVRDRKILKAERRKIETIVKLIPKEKCIILCTEKLNLINIYQYD